MRNKTMYFYLGGFLIFIIMPVLLISAVITRSNHKVNNSSNTVSDNNFKPDHSINIPKNGSINVRNRALTIAETALLNSDSRKEIHNSTWQGTLYHGDKVMLLGTEGWWYLIAYRPRGYSGINKGYISMYVEGGNSIIAYP